MSDWNLSPTELLWKQYAHNNEIYSLVVDGSNSAASPRLMCIDAEGSVRELSRGCLGHLSDKEFVGSAIHHGVRPISKTEFEQAVQRKLEEINSIVKIPLKVIGYWESMNPELQPDYVHPRILVDPLWRVGERDKIVGFLRRVPIAMRFMGLSPNRFAESAEEANRDHMGSGHHIDSDWLWPEGLARYVEEYHVRLPDEFVKHMRANNWLPSPSIEVGDKETLVEDDTFWVEWCREQQRLFDEKQA